MIIHNCLQARLSAYIAAIMPEFKKIPKKGVKEMPVYSKTSGLDKTKKGNKEKDANYTVNSSRTD